MNNKILKQTLIEVIDLADFVTSALEVVANSCAYKNDFAAEDILRLTLDKQYNIVDKISSLQVISENADIYSKGERFI